MIETKKAVWAMFRNPNFNPSIFCFPSSWSWESAGACPSCHKAKARWIVRSSQHGATLRHSHIYRQCRLPNWPQRHVFWTVGGSLRARRDHTWTRQEHAKSIQKGPWSRIEPTVQPYFATHHLSIRDLNVCTNRDFWNLGLCAYSVR